MNFDNLDLNLLVALDALLAEKNVTRAAERLYVTQSAMSHALARLRRAFDDPLLFRSGNQLELTARAEALVEPVAEILLRVSNLVRAPVDFEPRDSSVEFVLAMTEYTSAVLLADLVEEVDRVAPGVRLTVLDHDPEAELPLDSGKVDLVVTQPLRVRYPCQPLFVDEYGWVMPAAHPAAFDDLTVEALAHMGQAVYIGSRSLSDQPLEVALIDLGLSRDIRIRVSSLASISDAVLGAGLGALMPKRFFRHLQRSSELRLLDLPLRLPHIEPTMYWHELRGADPSHQWLRRTLLDVGRALPPVLGQGEAAPPQDDSGPLVMRAIARGEGPPVPHTFALDGFRSQTLDSQVSPSS